MATHSSILAQKISWTEEPDGLQSWGCKESDMTEHTHTCTSLIKMYSYCKAKKCLTITPNSKNT